MNMYWFVTKSYTTLKLVSAKVAEIHIIGVSICFLNISSIDCPGLPPSKEFRWASMGKVLILVSLIYFYFLLPVLILGHFPINRNWD